MAKTPVSNSAFSPLDMWLDAFALTTEGARDTAKGLQVTAAAIMAWHEEATLNAPSNSIPRLSAMPDAKGEARKAYIANLKKEWIGEKATKPGKNKTRLEVAAYVSANADWHAKEVALGAGMDLAVNLSILGATLTQYDPRTKMFSLPIDMLTDVDAEMANMKAKRIIPLDRKKVTVWVTDGDTKKETSFVAGAQHVAKRADMMRGIVPAARGTKATAAHGDNASSPAPATIETFNADNLPLDAMMATIDKLVKAVIKVKNEGEAGSVKTSDMPTEFWNRIEELVIFKGNAKVAQMKFDAQAADKKAAA